jgi:DNA-binding response OmpR family regulator
MLNTTLFDISQNDARIVHVYDAPVRVRPSEFRVLWILAEQVGETVPLSKIGEAMGTVVSDVSSFQAEINGEFTQRKRVFQHMKRIRERLPSGWITWEGSGYRFQPKVEVAV